MAQRKDSEASLKSEPAGVSKKKDTKEPAVPTKIKSKSKSKGKGKSKALEEVDPVDVDPQDCGCDVTDEAIQSDYLKKTYGGCAPLKYVSFLYDIKLLLTITLGIPMSRRTARSRRPLWTWHLMQTYSLLSTSRKPLPIVV